MPHGNEAKTHHSYYDIVIMTAVWLYASCGSWMPLRKEKTGDFSQDYIFGTLLEIMDVETKASDKKLTSRAVI